ncbi:MAG: type IX secretion system membrane protein PorP/SprF [Cytophagales bacterium]|nr:MAG: type IX secretion system membrane protein PorP/SprF [Cytophagales bacterium]
MLMKSIQNYYTPLLLGILLSMFFSKNIAQAQDLQPLMSQWMYNKLIYNPAYAGTNEGVSGSAVHRQQWIGFDKGRPITTTLSVDGAIKNQKIGLGLNLLNDRYGNISRTDIMGNAAYKIQLSDEMKLSMGLKFGVSNIRRNQVEVWDESDATFLNSDRNQAFLPRIGAGIYIDDPKFYAGISAPDLYVQDKNNFFTTNTSWKAGKDYMAFAGYNLFINDMYTLLPAAMIKFSKTRTYAELNLSVLYKDFFKAGLSYRSPYNTYAVITSFKLNDKLGAGIAYEFSPSSNKIELPSLGSTFELMLNYNLWQ